MLGGLAFPTATVSAKSAEKRYIVDLKDAESGALDGLTVVHDLSQIDIAVVEGDASAVKGTRHSKDVELRYEAEKEYDEDEDDEREYGKDDPEDGLPARFQMQWDKHAQELLEVHEETRGEGTRVAVIDSGAIRDHPDLAGPLNTELSKSFTGDGGDFTPFINDHGTHVSGIIAADGANEKGVLGTAPETDLLALRVFTGPFAFFGDIIAAMVYSADVGSDVANMSLGAYPLPKDADTATLRDSIERASGYADEKGTLMVAAAGNDGVNLDADGDVISLPNEADNVMSISATGPIGYRWDDGTGDRKGDAEDYHEGDDRDDEEQENDDFDEPLEALRESTSTPAIYTNYGRDAVDVSAPGGNYVETPPEGSDWQYDMVLSTVFEFADDGSMAPAYGWKAGTSMAAPQVAAAAALVKSRNPDATPGLVRRHLVATAKELDQPSYHGEGHLDLEEAVEEDIDRDDYQDDEGDEDEESSEGGEGEESGEDD